MTFGENSDQFLNGLKNIENKVIEDLLSMGIVAKSQNFIWNNSQSFIGVPSNVSLVISLNGKNIEARFSREQLEDSWDIISRADVRATIKHIVFEITR